MRETSAPADGKAGPPGLRELLASYERQLILMALHATSRNQSKAAAALGVLPTTLAEKMKRLGIPGARSGVRMVGQTPTETTD